MLRAQRTLLHLEVFPIRPPAAPALRRRSEDLPPAIPRLRRLLIPAAPPTFELLAAVERHYSQNATRAAYPETHWIALG